VFIRLAKLVGSLVLAVYDQLTMLIRRSLGLKIPGTCVVLYYHCVTHGQRVVFARQMDKLVQCCQPISTSKLGDLKPGVHHVAVTFDDGFQSVVQNALPELVTRNIPVTIFVLPACLGQCPSWPDVEEYIRACEVVIDQGQLVQLKKNASVTIGSHGMTHANLLHLEESEAKDEIFLSKLQLENMLDEEIRLLSFPFGSFSEAHVKWTREAGYSRVFTIVPELIKESDSGKYVIGRVKADLEDWPLEFRLKILGAYRWLPWAFDIKRRMKSLFAFRPNPCTRTEIGE
jgi:peptidoglycan/xylan/chitin deacetylase (PgdA/CDA1 family)